MLVKQGHASWGMAGNRNAEKIPINLYRFITINQLLRTGHGGSVRTMNDPDGAKASGIASRLRHIILVAE